MEKTLRFGPPLIPSLLVTDLQTTFAFYEQIGFARTGVYPGDGPPVWGEVSRDGVSLQFYTEAPHGTPGKPVCSGTFYVRAKDVLALADELRGAVPFAWGPEVMEYGMREFAIQDPNGYHLAFTEPA